MTAGNDPTEAPGSTAKAADPPLMPGTVVQSYRITEVIGQGGMGRVYRALHIKLERPVALKVLHASTARDRGAVGRFFDEARAVNRVRNEHIVEVTDFLEPEGGPVCTVMELLEGKTLGAVLADGPLPWRDAAVLAHQVARALAATHDAGIVHRDLKPDNVFVTERDGAPWVKVLDFGVAKLSGHDDVVVGTPAFMAPEQLQGEPVDGRADVWALGVLLYVMITGRRPFAGDFAGQLMLAHAAGAAPFEQDVPSELRELVAGCLAPRVVERIASMHEVAKALGRLTEERRSRRGWAVGLAAAGVLGVAAGALVAVGAMDPADVVIEGPRAPQVTETLVPVVPAIRKVRVGLTSTPAGALVYVDDDPAPLGPTPSVVELPAAGDPRSLRFELPDRPAVVITRVLDADGTVDAALPGRRAPLAGTAKVPPPPKKGPARSVILDPFSK